MVTYGGSNINHFSDDKKISGVDGHDLCDKLFYWTKFFFVFFFLLCFFVFFFFAKKCFVTLMEFQWNRIVLLPLLTWFRNSNKNL